MKKIRLRKGDRVVFIGKEFGMIDKGTRGRLIKRRNDGRWVVKWDGVTRQAHAYLMSKYGEIPTVRMDRNMLDLTKRK
jgi:hypothetical protein